MLGDTFLTLYLTLIKNYEWWKTLSAIVG